MEKYPDGPPPAYPSAGPPPYPTAPPPGFYVQPTGPVPVTAPTPVYVTAVPLNGEPQRMKCPHCQADIQTRVKYQAGRMTHIIALVLCLFGCYCCCCIPYCVEGCQDADHECPNCNKFIGHYRR